jgi:hypothetical protein
MIRALALRAKSYRRQSGMKKALIGLLLSALGVVALAFGRTGAARTFGTPAECATAYYQALLDADAAGYSACLSEKLRPAASCDVAADLRARSRGLLGWGMRGEGPIVVDEQYATERRRQKLYLEHDGTSWRVARIEPVGAMPADIPYGTHVAARRDED